MLLLIYPGAATSLIEKTKNIDFSPLTAGSILAEAIKKIAKEKPFCLAGFSYGTNVVAEILNHHISPKGISLASPFVTGEQHGLEKIFNANDYIFFHDVAEREQVMAAFSLLLKHPDTESVAIHTDDFFLAKPPFRSALIRSVTAGEMSDEIALLKKTGLSVQVIMGMEDDMLQIDYLDDQPFKAWKDRIYKLPGVGHYVPRDEPETFNALLLAYLEASFSH